MKRLVLAFLVIATPAMAAEKLAPPETVQEMMGDVAVYDAAESENCSVVLFDDKVAGGYRLEKYDGCDTTYPVMAKATAWRVYRKGELSFADAKGHDLITFRGKGFTYSAVKKVDGIVKIWSAQEVAE